MTATDAAVPVGTLLDVADSLLDDAAMTRGAWPRTAALLTRTALERATAQCWSARDVQVDDVSFSAQVLALRQVVDEAAAHDAAATWAALSRACHHHAYELPPTVGELRTWIEGVRRLAAELQHPPRGR